MLSKEAGEFSEFYGTFTSLDALYFALFSGRRGILAENVEKCLLNAFIFQCFSGGGGFIRLLPAWPFLS